MGLLGAHPLAHQGLPAQAYPPPMPHSMDLGFMPMMGPGGYMMPGRAHTAMAHPAHAQVGSVRGCERALLSALPSSYDPKHGHGSHAYDGAWGVHDARACTYSHGVPSACTGGQGVIVH